MALSQAEMQELQELEELAALEQEEASAGARSPALQAMPKEEGLKSTSFNPIQLGRSALEMMGLNTNAAGRNAVNTAAQGYLPQVVGGAKALVGGDYVAERDKVVKRLGQDMAEAPVSSMAGMGVGALASGAAASGAMAPAASGLGRIAQAAGMGAAQGATYNPGDVEGVVDPLQLKDRAVGAGLGATAGTLSGVVGEGIRKGANVANDIRLIKSGDASKYVKEEIDSALQSIDKNQLAPRDAKLKELIKGQTYEINPDRVESTFPRLAKSMRGNLAEGEVRRELSAARALRLKRAADAAANYGNAKPFDPVATAKGEEAKSLADLIRGQINSMPEAAAVNSEMQDILAQKSALARSASSAPISSIRAQPGTDKDSLVKAIDKLAGSNLEGLDNRIGSAKDLLLKPSNFLKPLEMPNEARKVAMRGGASLAEALSKLPAGAKEALLSQALEAKRQAK